VQHLGSIVRQLGAMTRSVGIIWPLFFATALASVYNWVGRTEVMVLASQNESLVL
jgi:hypothetical protein